MEGPIPAIAFVYRVCGTWRLFFENHFPVVHSSVSRMAQGRVSDICLKTATLRWWAEIAF